MSDLNFVSILAEIVQEEFNVKSQSDVAAILEIQQTQLSTYINKNNAGKAVIKKMLNGYAAKYAEIQKYTKVNPTKLLSEIVESTHSISSQSEISKVLNIGQGQLSNYSNKNDAGNNAVTNMILALLDSVTENNIKKVVQPILEFKKITPEKYNSKYQILPNEHKVDSLKQSLDGKIGVYLFYNSQGKNFYIGKTEKDLYSEICQQLGRKITFLGENLKKNDHLQGDVVSYLSAYEIAPKKLIGNIEALLVRCYANDHTNIKMENFKF